MRFGYVLLGLVTLASLHISSGQCSNGIAGVQFEDICCDASCVTCGGNGCGGRQGGPSSCCVGAISNGGMVCSDTGEAPCIIDNDGMCSNGLLGTQNGDICCEASCGTCGGGGCGNRVGGPDACCVGRIEDNDMMCSDTMAAPCIIDDEELPQVFCSNGLIGVESNGFCCDARCGTCGGRGCRSRRGGQDGCCTNQILASGIVCSNTTMAPCIIS